MLLWSTGFIGAKYALPYIEPFNVLFIRMLCALVLLYMLILWRRAEWPGWRQAGHQMVVGALIHAGYLGGVFAAMKLGMPAGIAALIVGLQPLLTAVISRYWFGSVLLPLQWAGLLLGLLGVSLVISGSRGLGDMSVISPMSLGFTGIALVCISVGTLYQKRYGAGTNLLTGSFYQYLITALIMLGLTQTTEQGDITWSWTLVLALAWLVIILSIVAISLLMMMIREGESAKVASYFYLVPIVTAIEAWLLFDEQLGLMAIIGTAIAVSGVFLTLRPQIRA